MKSALWRQLLHDGGRMLWPLLLASGVGWALQSLWPLLLVVAIMLAWQVWQKWRLARWLAAGQLLDPPHAGGLWEDYYTRLMHLFRAEQRAHASLASTIERARFCVDSIDTGVVLLDEKGQLAWYNHAARQLLELTSHDRGAILTQLLRHPSFSAYLAAADFRDALTLPTPSGDTTLEYHITPIDNQGLLLRVEDVTHLQTLENLRRDFVANVSHELKTPLTVFRAGLELLADQLPGERPALTKLLARMEQQSERMQSLVRDLLLLARLEGTRISDAGAERVGLVALCERLDASYGEAARAKQQQLSFAGVADLYVRGLPDELQSALGNLVANALNYTAAGCQVEVSAWEDGAGVHICVRDDGEGIAAQHLAHLTERFYRVDTSRSSAGGGTGLGLAIVKHVLMRHGGHLEIDSEEGIGSRFICHLPAPL